METAGARARPLPVPTLASVYVVPRLLVTRTAEPASVEMLPPRGSGSVFVHEARAPLALRPKESALSQRQQRSGSVFVHEARAPLALRPKESALSQRQQRSGSVLVHEARAPLALRPKESALSQRQQRSGSVLAYRREELAGTG